jgi:hypothetical protein
MVNNCFRVGAGRCFETDTQKTFEIIFFFLLLLGFASFMWFVAFSVFLSGAFYVSPMFCGSENEKKQLSKPQDVGEGTDLIIFFQIKIDNMVYL